MPDKDPRAGHPADFCCAGCTRAIDALRKLRDALLIAEIEDYLNEQASS